MGGAVFVVVVVHFRAVAGCAHIREQPAVVMPEHQPQPVVMIVFAAPGTVLYQQRLLRAPPESEPRPWRKQRLLRNERLRRFRQRLVAPQQGLADIRFRFNKLQHGGVERVTPDKPGEFVQIPVSQLFLSGEAVVEAREGSVRQQQRQRELQHRLIPGAIQQAPASAARQFFKGKKALQRVVVVVNRTFKP